MNRAVFPASPSVKIWFLTLNVPSSGSQMLKSPIIIPKTSGQRNQWKTMRRRLPRRSLKIKSGPKCTLMTTRTFSPNRILTIRSRPWQVISCVTNTLSDKMVLANENSRPASVDIIWNEGAKHLKLSVWYLRRLQTFICSVRFQEADNVVLVGKPFEVLLLCSPET